MGFTTVIHRDLKPANLMVNRQERIKITDFGIARIAKDSLTRMTGKDTSGTLLYMAPEQLRGKGVDGRSDIYSVGATMYELLSGRPPFHSGGLEYQILHEPPEPIAGLPERINAILLKALAKDKEQRWPSARALLEALEGRMEVDGERQKSAAEARRQPEEQERVEGAPRRKPRRLEKERRSEEPRVKEAARRAQKPREEALTHETQRPAEGRRRAEEERTPAEPRRESEHLAEERRRREEAEKQKFRHPSPLDERIQKCDEKQKLDERIQKVLEVIRRHPGGVDEAIKEYREVMLMPGFPEGHYILGLALEEERVLGEAIKEYREAIRIKPEEVWKRQLQIALNAKGTSK